MGWVKEGGAQLVNEMRVLKNETSLRGFAMLALFGVLGILTLMQASKELKNVEKAKLERVVQAKECAKEATVSARAMQDLGYEYIGEWHDNESVVLVHGKFFHLEHNEYKALKRAQMEKRESVYTIDYDGLETLTKEMTAAEKDPR